MYFNLASNRLNHANGDRRLTIDEWMRSSDRAHGILQQMARVPNSNENFELDDSFQLSFTQVREPPKGSGHKRKMKPGHTHPETFKHLKHTVSHDQEQRRVMLCPSHCYRQRESGQSPKMVQF